MKRYLSLAIIVSTMAMGIGTSQAAQSIASLEQKTDENPQDVKALYQLTRLYCKQGMADEAIASWRMLADLAPEKASELYLKAWVAVFLGIEPFYPQQICDRHVQQPRLSPDGRWIIFVSLNNINFNVARMDFFGQNFSWITAEPFYHQFPSFVGSSDEVLYIKNDQSSSGEKLISRNIENGETKEIFSELVPGVTYTDQAKPQTPVVFSYLSPDTKTQEIGLYDTKKDQFIELTSSPYMEASPRFSSDGKLIVFSSNPRLNNDLFIMDTKGRVKEQLTFTDEFERNPDFGDNDNKVAFSANLFALGQIDIGIYDRRTGDIIPVTCSEADDDFPDISDDGKWMIFQSSRSPEQLSAYFVSLDQHVPMEVLIEEIDKK